MLSVQHITISESKSLFSTHALNLLTISLRRNSKQSLIVIGILVEVMNYCRFGWIICVLFVVDKENK